MEPSELDNIEDLSEKKELYGCKREQTITGLHGRHGLCELFNTTSIRQLILINQIIILYGFINVLTLKKWKGSKWDGFGLYLESVLVVTRHFVAPATIL